MATASTHLLARHLRHLATAPTTDGELLERFALRGEEAAFEALLRRHGAMVLGVCRRMLGDRHAAEDCFQAVFLVLARQAGSLRQPEALAGWLYGVALRTARKARAQAARRRTCERRSARPVVAEPPDELLWRDLRSVLDEAIALLPVKYRLPFVLHHLEGLTVTQAAAQLDCPVGTVAARLARARDQLRRRLVRRGLTLAAGALTAALAEGLARARVPPPLLSSTLRAAALVAAIPDKIATLTQGVLTIMTLTQRKAAILVVLALALLSGSAAWMAHPLPAAAPKPGQTGGKRTAPQDREDIQGEWAVLSEIQEGKDITQGKTTLVFSGETLTFRDDNKDSCKATFDLCPLTRPGRIDVVFAREGWSLLGLYRLEGDLLTLCLAVPGTRRPTTFESRAGSRLVLFVLKRNPRVQGTRAEPSSPHKDVLINVQETRTGSLLFGLGSNSNAGATGSIVLNERHFDGRTFFVPFVDSGTVAPRGSSAGPQVSAGMGIRIGVPPLGPVPVSLEYGFPIVKGEKERKKAFSFWTGFFR